MEEVSPNLVLLIRWVLNGIGVSLLCFVAGTQSLSKRRPLAVALVQAPLPVYSAQPLSRIKSRALLTVLIVRSASLIVYDPYESPQDADQWEFAA